MVTEQHRRLNKAVNLVGALRPGGIEGGKELFHQIVNERKNEHE
jgi:hypothetical protein